MKNVKFELSNSHQQMNDNLDEEPFKSNLIPSELPTETMFESILNNNFLLNKKIKILVLSGGGTKGIAHIGISKCLDKLCMLKDIEIFVGTSIGAFISCMLYIGYTPKEIKAFSMKLNYNLIKDSDFSSFIENYGLDDGSKLEYVIKTVINKKFGRDNITLIELFNITKKKFISVTTCVNTGNTHYIDYTNNPNIPLYLAVKMSLSIPLLFCPVKYNGNFYVDGGSTCNYPIDLFAERIEEVLGVYLYNESKNNDIESIKDYMVKLIFTFTDNVTCELLKKYIKNTIIIKFEDMDISNFDLTFEQKKEVYHKGFNACLNKLCPTI